MELQNPFTTATEAIAHMTDYQCRLTLAALIGRLIFAGHYGYSDADLISMLQAVAAGDPAMWANVNAARAAQ